VWKKIAIGFNLLVTTLVVTRLVTGWLPLATLPLQKGMTYKEVEALFGQSQPGLSTFGGGWETCYTDDPDVFGYQRQVRVYYDRNDHVVNWETMPPTQTPPPWLDKAMKAVRW
jgi:hypothetical protein